MLVKVRGFGWDFDFDWLRKQYSIGPAFLGCIMEAGVTKVQPVGCFYGVRRRGHGKVKLRLVPSQGAKLLGFPHRRQACRRGPGWTCWKLIVDAATYMRL